ncbi:MAG: tyrosine-type recombinase/integrase [Planctomycetes bacterium]|nr:tyrosine-type recombinase/integrase [Planctomycetota bacterium]
MGKAKRDERKTAKAVAYAYFGGKRLVGLYPRKRKLATGKNRTYYQARIPYAGGRKLVSFGTDRDEATQQFMELDRAFKNGEVKSRDDTRNTVQDLIDVLLDHTKSEKSTATYDQYRFLVKGFAARYGHRYADDVRPADIAKEKRIYQEEGKSPETINHHLKVINRVFNYAVKLELIETNPAKNIEKVAKDTPKKGRPVTDAEMKAMIEACEKAGEMELRDAVIVLEQTGLRIGELAQMTAEWAHFDGEGGGFIVIPPSADKTWRTRKDKQPRRISMSPDVAEILRPRQSRGGALFQGSRGGPFDKDAAGKLWNRMRSEAKLPKDITLHCLRHRFIIKARKAGMTYEQLEPITGNSAEVMRRYYSEWDEQDISDMMQPVFAQFNRWGDRQD